VARACKQRHPAVCVPLPQLNSSALTALPTPLPVCIFCTFCFPPLDLSRRTPSAFPTPRSNSCCRRQCRSSAVLCLGPQARPFACLVICPVTAPGPSKPPRILPSPLPSGRFRRLATRVSLEPIHVTNGPHTTAAGPDRGRPLNTLAFAVPEAAAWCPSLVSPVALSACHFLRDLFFVTSFCPLFPGSKGCARSAPESRIALAGCFQRCRWFRSHLLLGLVRPGLSAGG